MAEAGVDISKQKSKLISELPEHYFDYVITVCDHAAEKCPLFPGNARHIHQGFPDPPEMAKSAETREEEIQCYREVRDSIKDYINGLDQDLMI